MNTNKLYTLPDDQNINNNKVNIMENNSNNSNLLDSSNNSLQKGFDQLIEKYDQMQMEYDIIINELLLLFKSAEQKEINNENYGQLIKQHINSRNTNEDEIFNYLSENKDKQQNIILLAIFYQYGIGTDENIVKTFELFKEATKNGDINVINKLGLCYEIIKYLEKAFYWYQKAIREYQERRNQIYCANKVLALTSIAQWIRQNLDYYSEQFIFNIQKWFEPHIFKWLEEIDAKTPKLVDSVIKVDKVKFNSNY